MYRCLGLSHPFHYDVQNHREYVVAEKGDVYRSMGKYRELANQYCMKRLVRAEAHACHWVTARFQMLVSI